MKFSDLVALTKPRISFLVILTTIAGYYIGEAGAFDFVLLASLVVGTGLVVSGTSALNQLVEARIDGRMKRTRKRPLPDGRLTPLQAHAFGTLCAISGIAFLAVFVNPLTSFLAALTLVLYVFVYTPMKRKSTISTLVGAVPGALPPVGGWAAARGELGLEAMVLFAILFFWQMPHFLAIAWLYREDYARGGLQVLPLLDQAGHATSRHIIANTFALLVISLMPTMLGLAGSLYFFGAIALGVGFLAAGIRVAVHRTNKSARTLLLASVLYLPLLFILMSVDKVSF